MKLWIRSQNKCKSREAECVYYYYEAGKHIIDCNGYPVGTYESKRRCLEIIDEIQGLLISDFAIIKNLNVCDDFQKMLKNTKGISYSVPNEKPTVEHHSLSAVVYEMPEE